RAPRATPFPYTPLFRSDYVDVYYYHQPDGITPVAETTAAMGELVEEGRVRAIGVSNFSVEQLDEAVAAGSVAVLQNHYNLLEREDRKSTRLNSSHLGIS